MNQRKQSGKVKGTELTGNLSFEDVFTIAKSIPHLSTALRGLHPTNKYAAKPNSHVFVPKTVLPVLSELGEPNFQAQAVGEGSRLVLRTKNRSFTFEAKTAQSAAEWAQ